MPSGQVNFLYIMEEADLKRILSSKIKYYRGLKGWSQVRLAEKIDISTNFLADVETGKSWVSSLTLVKLANCFGIEVYDLFRPEDTMPPDEVKETVKSLITDFSISFERSLSQISQKYLD